MTNSNSLTIGATIRVGDRTYTFENETQIFWFKIGATVANNLLKSRQQEPEPLPNNGWLSVHDHANLPKKSGRVQVFDPTKAPACVRIEYFDVRANHYGDFLDTIYSSSAVNAYRERNGFSKTVTHWRPLSDEPTDFDMPNTDEPTPANY